MTDGILPIVSRAQADQVVRVVTVAHVMRYMRDRRKVRLAGNVTPVP